MTPEQLLRVARGCRDYKGGYDGEIYEAFQAGIETVIQAIESAMKNPQDPQTRALESMGAAAPKILQFFEGRTTYGKECEVSVSMGSVDEYPSWFVRVLIEDELDDTLTFVAPDYAEKAFNLITKVLAHATSREDALRKIEEKGYILA